MKPLPHVAVALILLAGGVLVGRGAFSPPDPRNTDKSFSMDSSSTRSARSESANQPALKKAGTKRDLAHLRERMRQWSGNAAGQRQELERLDVGALKGIVMEQIALSGGGKEPKELEARNGVIRAVIHELYRREGPAAIEWIDGVEDANARRNAMMTVLMEAVRDHPDTALPWIHKLQKASGSGPSITDTFPRLAFAGAAQRGADEMIRIHGMFADHLRGSPLDSTEFPRDFDYEKFHTALSGKIDMADLFTQWAVRDKEAAWEAVKRDLESRGQPGGRYFGSLVVGAVATQGEEAGVKWAVEQMAGLPPEQRKHCISNLDHMGKLTTEGISAIMSGLPTEDRKTFAQSVINSSGGGEKVLAALDALPRGDLIEVLQEGAKRYSGSLSAPKPGAAGAEIRRLYEEVDRRYSLTPEEISNIRAGDGIQ